MRRTIGTALWLALAANAAAAGTDRPRPGDIPVDEWRAMAEGRTVTYRINGDFWALEHYFPGTDRVQLQLNDGTCLDGSWDYQEPHYCFHWDGQGTSCFRHVRVSGRIVVIQTENGIDTALTQEAAAVTDAPLSCGLPVTS
jgi:hypothetical protein